MRESCIYKEINVLIPVRKKSAFIDNNYTKTATVLTRNDLIIKILI